MTCLEVGRNGRFCAGALDYQQRIKDLEAEVERLSDMLSENLEIVGYVKARRQIAKCREVLTGHLYAKETTLWVDLQDALRDE